MPRLPERFVHQDSESYQLSREVSAYLGRFRQRAGQLERRTHLLCPLQLWNAAELPKYRFSMTGSLPSSEGLIDGCFLTRYDQDSALGEASESAQGLSPPLRIAT